MDGFEVEVSAAPTSAPWQCVVCERGAPADGPFVRLPGRISRGEPWLCAVCQEVVLAANRLMSLRLYEARVADLKGHVGREVEALEVEKARLLDVERREGDAARRAAESESRAELAQGELEALRSTVASLERSLAEANERAAAAERGSFVVRAIEERFDRFEEIVAANAGPEKRTRRPAAEVA